MPRILILTLALSCFFYGSGQSVPTNTNDFIVLRKKNGRPVKNYFKGSYIRFQLKDKNWVEGSIRKIKKDTVYINVQRIGLVPDNAGFGLKIDTLSYGGMAFSFKDIYAIPRQYQSSLLYVKNGRLLQAAGAGYIVLNVVNGAIDGEPIFDDKNIKRLSIAAGVFAVGQVLHMLYRPNMRIGKRFQLQYVEVVPIQ